ncbi:MAG: chloride channel protein [Clostridia bacterium]|nr:chloride channel protein [Clostridia bacterium]
MKTERLTYIKNILIPCLVFSSLTGIFTGMAVFAFRMAASAVIALSGHVYVFVRAEPIWLPLLLGGAATLGLLESLLLHVSRNCRGGGIPTAVALLRGLIHFHWIKSIFVLFASAMMSFLAALPLGNEGPCVQMGTAMGRGTVRVFAKKNPAWDRYIMTGGACAGFAVATGAPLSGILFAFEEAHRRFSPMIFMTAAVAVVSSTVTANALCGWSGTRLSMFGFSLDTVLPPENLWAALIVGIVTGVCAVLFTKLYRMVGRLLNQTLKKLPFTLKLVFVFVAVALLGFASAELIGSGHSLIDVLLEGHGVWYLSVLYLCVRAVMLLFANHACATGGLFVPSLAFGALIGSLCADAMVAMGVLSPEYYGILVTVGMASFLGASARTPIMAVSFAAEALCGFTNLLPVVVGVAISFLVIETVGLAGFNDTVIENKVEAEHRGKTAQIVDTRLTVAGGAFAVGKEIRDILWPPSCVILSVHKSTASEGSFAIGEGDVLQVHYRTFDPPETVRELEALVGSQDKDTERRMHEEEENDSIPEQ